MAKPFKRLSVPLTENSYRAIERLAEAKGTSLAATISDFLDANHPAMLQIAEAVIAAKTNPALAYQLVQEIAARAQKDLAEEQLDFLSRGSK